MSHRFDPDVLQQVVEHVAGLQLDSRDLISRTVELLAGEYPDLIDPTPGRWRSYYENIADALTGRAELAVTAASVRQTLVAIEAARLSAAEGRVIIPGEIA